MEQGQVIGLYPTEGNNVWRNLNSVLDWSGVGGVYETAPRLEKEFKYVPGFDGLDGAINHHAPGGLTQVSGYHCLWRRKKIEQEIYEPYMGK